MGNFEAFVVEEGAAVDEDIAARAAKAVGMERTSIARERGDLLRKDGRW